MFVNIGKAEPRTTNIIGLNLAAVKTATAQESELFLWQPLSKIRHHVLQKVWNGTGRACSMYSAQLKCSLVLYTEHKKIVFMYVKTTDKFGDTFSRQRERLKTDRKQN